MPRGDRTGPEGFGPMTGRAAGYCSGYDEPGFMDQASGRGELGRGISGRGIPGRGMPSRGVRGGFGRGRRNQYFATGLPGWRRAHGGQAGMPGYPGPAGPMGMPDPYGFASVAPPLTREQELTALNNQVKMMQENVRAAQERIEELEKDEGE